MIGSSDFGHPMCRCVMPPWPNGFTNPIKKEGQMKGKKLPRLKIELSSMDNDPVHHPAHYTTGKIEVWSFIEDKKLGFHLGNVVKYVCRAGKKSKGTRIQDLEKACAYLNRKIHLLKQKEWQRANHCSDKAK